MVIHTIYNFFESIKQYPITIIYEQFHFENVALIFYHFLSNRNFECLHKIKKNFKILSPNFILKLSDTHPAKIQSVIFPEILSVFILSTNINKKNREELRYSGVFLRYDIPCPVTLL